MSYKTATRLLLLTAITGLSACSETRKDPCRLLSVTDIQSADDTVTVSAWAGRDGEKQENEVCMFYSDNGDSRLMLFVWYDTEKTPAMLIEQGVSDRASEIVDIPGIGTEAAAAFADDELKLLAARSARGLVGIRARKSVRKGSAELENIERLAEKALINID